MRNVLAALCNEDLSLPYDAHKYSSKPTGSGAANSAMPSGMGHSHADGVENPRLYGAPVPGGAPPQPGNPNGEEPATLGCWIVPPNNNEVTGARRQLATDTVHPRVPQQVAAGFPCTAPGNTSAQYDTNTFLTPFDRAQGMVATGSLVNTYTGEIASCFEDELPPPDREAGDTKRERKSSQLRLLAAEGNAPTSRRKKEQEDPLQAGDAGTIMEAASHRVNADVQAERFERSERDLYFNRNELAPTELMQTRNPFGFDGYSNRLRINPFMPVTQELDNKSWIPNSVPIPTTVAQPRAAHRLNEDARPGRQGPATATATFPEPVQRMTSGVKVSDTARNLENQGMRPQSCGLQTYGAGVVGGEFVPLPEDLAANERARSIGVSSRHTSSAALCASYDSLLDTLLDQALPGGRSARGEVLAPSASVATQEMSNSRFQQGSHPHAVSSPEAAPNGHVGLSEISTKFQEDSASLSRSLDPSSIRAADVFGAMHTTGRSTEGVDRGPAGFNAADIAAQRPSTAEVTAHRQDGNATPFLPRVQACHTASNSLTGSSAALRRDETQVFRTPYQAGNFHAMSASTSQASMACSKTGGALASKNRSRAVLPKSCGGSVHGASRKNDRPEWLHSSTLNSQVTGTSSAPALHVTEHLLAAPARESSHAHRWGVDAGHIIGGNSAASETTAHRNTPTTKEGPSSFAHTRANTQLYGANMADVAIRDVSSKYRDARAAPILQNGSASIQDVQATIVSMASLSPEDTNCVQEIRNGGVPDSMLVSTSESKRSARIEHTRSDNTLPYADHGGLLHTAESTVSRTEAATYPKRSAPSMETHGTLVYVGQSTMPDAKTLNEYSGGGRHMSTSTMQDGFAAHTSEFSALRRTSSVADDALALRGGAADLARRIDPASLFVRDLRGIQDMVTPTKTRIGGDVLLDPQHRFDPGLRQIRNEMIIEPHAGGADRVLIERTHLGHWHSPHKRELRIVRSPKPATRARSGLMHSLSDTLTSRCEEIVE